MKKFIQRLLWKQDPALYRSKDAKLTPSLRTIDLVGLGTGMVVGTAIFTLPGIVAAEHTGPAVPLAFIVAAIGAGLSALAYALHLYCRLLVQPFHGLMFFLASFLVGLLAGHFWLSILFQLLSLRQAGQPICRGFSLALVLNCPHH